MYLFIPFIKDNAINTNDDNIFYMIIFSFILISDK